MLGRQQLDLVTLNLERPRPVVAQRPSGGQRRRPPSRSDVGAVDEDSSETLSRQALALNQTTLFIADRQIENSLCQVSDDGGSAYGWVPSAR